MESLGDILRRITERNARRSTNGAGLNLERLFAEATEREAICPICQGAGWVSKQAPVGHPDFGEAFPCRCQQQGETATQADALYRYSNLGPLRRITFHNTQEEGVLPDEAGRRMFRQGFAAAAAFAENPSGWLILTGPSGSGKTHLAVAAANRCIELGYTTYFIVVADLLDHLRSGYAQDNPISYPELFDQVRNAPILALDDLTAEAATPWAQEKLFQIISHRFNAQLPTIITVRGPLERLDEGLRTRMEHFNGFSQVLRLGEHNTRLSRRIGGIPGDMQQRMTLASFDVWGSPNATDADRATLHGAKRAAETFIANPEGWMLFTGPRGCGKTHLAIAIAGEGSRRQGLTTFYAFVPSLLDHLRSTFSPDSPIGYDELFEQVKTAPLLILDDLGAESSTPWAEEKLYQIVVYRYDARLPTIITSIFDVNQLNDAKLSIGSRLVDGTMVTWCPINAPNYRDQRRQR